MKVDFLIDEIKTNTKYRKLSNRIRIDIDTTDVLNTYGFKQVINCQVLEVRSICINCKSLKGEHLKKCSNSDIHNFKQLFVPILNTSGNTVEEALSNLLGLLKSES